MGPFSRGRGFLVHRWLTRTFIEMTSGGFGQVVNAPDITGTGQTEKFRPPVTPE